MQLLEFDWISTDPLLFHIHMSPQDVIENLGPPDYLFGSIRTNADAVIVGISMIYREGLSFGFRYGVPYTNMSWSDDPGAHNTYSIELCLKEPITYKSYPRVGGMLIFPPFQTLNEFPPLQDALIGGFTSNTSRSRPFEELFGIDSANLAQRVQQEDNVCLEQTFDFE